jgi:hypothetical protein
MKQYYEFTMKAFGKENIKKRYDYLLDKVNDFLVSRNIDSHVAVDKRILQELVIDYFRDSERIRNFLRPVTADKNVCSYLGYWIVKKKPLVLADKTDYKLRLDKPCLGYVNEWFAFHLILGYKYSKNNYGLFFDI